MKHEIKRLAAYVEAAKPTLRLSDWTILVQEEAVPPADEPHTLASTYTISGRKLARIVFYEEFWSLTAREQRHVVAHELVHIHVNKLMRHINGPIAEHINPPAYSLWAENARIDMEMLVDNLAEVVDNSLELTRFK